MKTLNWEVDPTFSALSKKIVLKPFESVAEQFAGDIGEVRHYWTGLVDEPLGENLDYRIESILSSAKHEDWLLFVLQVGIWGQMIPGTHARPYRKIYDCSTQEPVSKERLHQIKKCLANAMSQLIDNQPLEVVWQGFEKVNWSDVMISKCLHFMCRTLEYRGAIVVPIDNAMVQNTLWVAFKKFVGDNNQNWPRPARVVGQGYIGYQRYFTAMHEWSEKLGISNSQLEFNLFHAFRQNVDFYSLFEAIE